MELVDVGDLKFPGLGRAGSSPVEGTTTGTYGGMMKENLSEIGLAMFNGTADGLSYWFNYAVNQTWVIVSLLLIALAVLTYPYVKPKLQLLGWRIRGWRSRKMGIYNSWALRLRIMDYLVDKVDEDYLAGHITHKQRQKLYEDLGTCLGLADLKIPKKLKSLHPALMEIKKAEAKKRLGLDPDKPLVEQMLPKPTGKRRRNLVRPAIAAAGEPLAMKIS